MMDEFAGSTANAETRPAKFVGPRFRQFVPMTGWVVGIIIRKVAPGNLLAGASSVKTRSRSLLFMLG